MMHARALVCFTYVPLPHTSHTLADLHYRGILCAQPNLRLWLGEWLCHNRALKDDLSFGMTGGGGNAGLLASALSLRLSVPFSFT